jgi:hypothetical protein
MEPVPFIMLYVPYQLRRRNVARKRKPTARGRKQDRARVAGGQRYEVSYESKKTGRNPKRVKAAVKGGRQQPQEGREAAG